MNGDRILIVGGGASGVILAAHLLRDGDPSVEVTIVERRPRIGAGVAYGTDQPDHLLNTRASGMSAFPDDPSHFWRWLQEGGRAERLGCRDDFCFVPRRDYRDYLADLVAPWLAEGGDGRLRVVAGECVDLREVAGGVAAELGDGRVEIGIRAVLATGHAVPVYGPDAPYSGPWCSPEELGIGTGDDVVILGTGLSMVDNVAQLRRAGHRGRITAVSRRGLLPHVHAPAKPLPLDPADVPFGTGPAFLLRWLRRTVRWAAAQGVDWRGVVDALRPHTQAIWGAMTPDARRRFLRHARTYWEVHRHRLAPEADTLLREAMAEGHLTVLAGRLLKVERGEGGQVVQLRRRGGGEVRVAASHVIDCTGILRDPAGAGDPLTARLIAAGRARLDPLGIGIEVAGDGAVVPAEGPASRCLFAVGPVTRARFWEITAVPDIRVQSAALARHLLRVAA